MRVVFEGSLADCEERMLTDLRTRFGTGRWNVPFATMGAPVIEYHRLRSVTVSTVQAA